MGAWKWALLLMPVGLGVLSSTLRLWLARSASIGTPRWVEFCNLAPVILLLCFSQTFGGWVGFLVAKAANVNYPMRPFADSGPILAGDMVLAMILLLVAYGVVVAVEASLNSFRRGSTLSHKFEDEALALSDEFKQYVGGSGVVAFIALLYLLVLYVRGG